MAETKPGRVVVRCTCGAKLSLRAQAAGHKAKCPKCKAKFVVPKPEAVGAVAPQYVPPNHAQPKATPKPELLKKIIVECMCGSKLRIRPDARAHNIKCPKCSQSFVPADTPAAASSSKPAEAPQPELAPGSLLDVLAFQEDTARSLTEESAIAANSNRAKG